INCSHGEVNARLGLSFPTLKRWAIVVCPSGIGPQTCICMDTTAQHESTVPQVSSQGGYFSVSYAASIAGRVQERGGYGLVPARCQSHGVLQGRAVPAPVRSLS